MHMLKMAAFCAGDHGGNPAGVVLAPELPSDVDMQRMAAEVGPEGAVSALGGYLRDLAWEHGGCIDVPQGDDMGVPCRIHVEIGPGHGGAVRLSGAARFMAD